MPLLLEPALWQAAVFRRSSHKIANKFGHALSLQRWLKRHGPNLSQLQLSQLPFISVCDLLMVALHFPQAILHCRLSCLLHWSAVVTQREDMKPLCCRSLSMSICQTLRQQASCLPTLLASRL